MGILERPRTTETSTKPCRASPLAAIPCLSPVHSGDCRGTMGQSIGKHGQRGVNAGRSPQPDVAGGRLAAGRMGRRGRARLYPTPWPRWTGWRRRSPRARRGSESGSSSIRRSTRPERARGRATCWSVGSPCTRADAAASSPTTDPASAWLRDARPQSPDEGRPPLCRGARGLAHRRPRDLQHHGRASGGPGRRLGPPAGQAPGIDGAPAEDKIAAIGIRVRRWVAFHGISLNVEPDLSHFRAIVLAASPNGISA